MVTSDLPNIETLLHQQETLRQVIESISSELELRPLLTRIIVHACELLGADRGTVGLVDEEHNVVRTEAIFNMPPDELGKEFPPGIGLSGKVYQTRMPVMLERYGELETPLYSTMLDDAVLGVPVVWRDKMIGFLGIGVAPPCKFERWHVETLSLFSRHAAIAIINAQLYTTAQKTVDETRLLYETSQHISSAVTLEEVILGYLKQVAVGGRYTCNIALYEFAPDGRRTAVIVRGNWSPGQEIQLSEQRYPYTYDSLDAPLDQGQTVRISNVYIDPRVSASLREIQRQSARSALAMIPLIVRGRRIGLVILSYPMPHQWSDDALRPYQTTAAQLATAIDSRIQQKLLMDRSGRIAVLEERQRLARELHDSVTQLIFSMTLIAQSITPAWRRNPVEGEQRVNRLLELSQAALAEMRALLAELRPPVQVDQIAVESFDLDEQNLSGTQRLRKHGLLPALDKYIKMMAQDRLEVRLEASNYVRQPVETEEALLRIAQEAFNNAVKHAQAERVSINLNVEAEGVYLRVQDDGKGFSTAGKVHAGMGLRTMLERAEMLDGKLNVISAPGQGTTIEVMIPN